MMWSWASSLWPFGSYQGPNPPQPALESPPSDFQEPATRLSPRLYQCERDGRITYAIEADLFPNRQDMTGSGPILYLNTSCVAIADYCLLGRRSEMFNDTNSLQLDSGSPEHLEVCLRLRRCSAVKLCPKSWDFEHDCLISLESHVNKIRYLFGWPQIENANSSSDTPQPVWVYYITRRGGWVRHGVIQYGGMEEQMELEILSGCSTMDEYCEKLMLRGAVFYADVRNCPEARHAGLVERAMSLDGA